jgi:exonuclease 1
MLLDFGVTPYLVFDGDNLPNKAGTNRERRKRRDESKALGLELYRAGKLAQAHQELQKAADVTPLMARELIEELKKANVQYLVAPYEADAQLVYLEQTGIINGILSEDSVMLVFGAKRLITKLNQYGECVEIERADFPLCKDISLTGWTDAMFRRMAILSGCDYLPNIEKMGLKTAYRFIRKYKDAEKTIKMVQFEGKLSVPADYLQRFKDAELTFLHHRVYCPIQQKMVHLHELPRGTKAEDMPYLGIYVDQDIATGVACGDLDPKTKEPLKIQVSARTSLAKISREATVAHSELKPNKSIDSFFKAYRQPLAELDPNTLTPSPSQQRLQAQYRNTSWAPRLVSSAPQLRRSVTSTQAVATDRNTFLARASAISTFQPPKRPRLCSDGHDPSPSKEVKRSPFFAIQASAPSPSAQKAARNKKAKRAEFDVWSDDSLDEAFLSLPDIQQAASPAKKRVSETAPLANPQEKTVFADPVPQSSPVGDGVGSGPDDADVNATPEDEDIEPFEDLLESHLRMQRDSLLKTYAYQSPPRREEALRSLTKKPDIDTTPRTFSAQSPQRQLAALESLPTSGPISKVCEKFMVTPATIRAPQPFLLRPSPQKHLRINRDESSRQVEERTTSADITYPVIRLSGSEDELIPNSEEDVSDGEVNETASKLDLKAFAYIP